MGRRQRRRDRDGVGAQVAAGPRTTYEHPEAGVLAVRADLSAGTLSALRRLERAPAASQEDAWQRRGEMLFERLVVSWELAGLPLEEQKELLGRYRMADASTRSWVRETLLRHVRERHPDLTI